MYFLLIFCVYSIDFDKSIEYLKGWIGQKIEKLYSMYFMFRNKIYICIKFIENNALFHLFIP